MSILSTSSECDRLVFISKPLSFAGRLAFWGAVLGPVYVLHPLWLCKGAYLNLQQLTSAL